jgi:S-adenosylmethionine:tRNA ribosyltransferase-isomerase
MRWESEAIDEIDWRVRRGIATVTDDAGAAIGAPRHALATAEVSRHAVRLVTIDRRSSRVMLRRFAELPELLAPGDLVVVNDAATLPASLRGRTAAGAELELRLAAPPAGARLDGVLFGAGDWRTRTEHRPPPPVVAAGDTLAFGSICARVVAVTGRRVQLDTAGGDGLWQALYASGTPVQYAHRAAQLPLYEVQTAYASRPWAAEMPSAGRPLTWDVLLGLRRRGIAIATLTHAAGLSSTGDRALDDALPWPERYEIPERTAGAIAQTRAAGGRVIAIGTTVVRALEASAGVAGAGIATLRITAETRLHVADGLVSGLHVPGESHFDLLRAFAPRARLERALALAAEHGLSSHELGDACAIL